MADKKLNIKVGLKGAKKAEKGLGKVNSSMKSMAKTALVAGGSFFAVQGIIRGFSAVIKLAGVQEQAEKKLSVALGHTSKALLNQASALQKMTTFGDEAIIGVQASLAAFIKNEDQIKLATKATLDMAVAMGMDLKSAGDLVAKTLGSSTNAMSRYGIEVVGAVGSTERLESLTNNVAKLFGGQAKAQADTMTGALEQMKNALGDVGEQIGSSLAPAVTGMAKEMQGLAESFNIGMLEKFSRGIIGISVAYAAYSSAAIFARLKTIEFQASLVKTGYGALIVGAGLAVGEMMRLAGWFTTAEGELGDLNKQMKAFNERSFLQLDISEQKEKILETQESLRSMFTEGAKGSKMFESFIKSTSLAINRQGLTASEAEAIHAVAVKAGVAVRVGAMEAEGDTYDTFLEKKKEMNELSAQELLFIERLKSEYPELAASLGLLSDTTAISVKHARVLGEAFGSLASLNKAAAGGFRVTARLQQAASIANTYAAATAALAPPPVGYGPTPIGYIAAGGAIATGLANVLEISRSIGDMSGFAQGGIVPGQGTGDTVPAMLTPGEVILNQAQQSNLVGGMGGVTINVSAPLVDETILDTIIPAIEKAHRMNLA